jgi:hypothetical protein
LAGSGTSGDVHGLLRVGPDEEPCLVLRSGALPIATVREKEAICAYESFVKRGLSEGRRADLVGGGFVRSKGGWRTLMAGRPERRREKGDERILESGKLAERVLELAQEQLEQRSRLLTKGPDLETVLITPPA